MVTLNFLLVLNRKLHIFFLFKDKDLDLFLRVQVVQWRLRSFSATLLRERGGVEIAFKFIFASSTSIVTCGAAAIEIAAAR